MRTLLRTALALPILLLAVAAGAAVPAASGQIHAQTPPPLSFTGAAGKRSQGPFNLNAGVTVVRAKHNGRGYFGVSLDLPSPGLTIRQAQATDGFTESDLVYNSAAGRVTGGAVVVIGSPGAYYLDVDASGAYQVTLEQPLPETVTPVQQQTVSGQVQQVSPYFSLPAGAYTVSLQADPNESVVVRLYALDDLGGAAVISDQGDYRGDQLIAAGDPPSATITLPTDGIYLLYVDAEGNGSPKWTVTIQ